MVEPFEGDHGHQLAVTSSARQIRVIPEHDTTCNRTTSSELIVVVQPARTVSELWSCETSAGGEEATIVSPDVGERRERVLPQVEADAPGGVAHQLPAANDPGEVLIPSRASTPGLEECAAAVEDHVHGALPRTTTGGAAADVLPPVQGGIRPAVGVVAAVHDRAGAHGNPPIGKYAAGDRSRERVTSS